MGSNLEPMFSAALIQDNKLKLYNLPAHKMKEYVFTIFALVGIVLPTMSAWAVQSK